MDKVKIFTADPKWDLPKLVAKELGVELGRLSSKAFADKETWIRFSESVRNKRIFLIQENTPAKKLFILQQMIDAAKRASAAEINAVIPYFGWARQDRIKGRDCVSAKIAVDNIVNAGANKLMSMDLHFPQMPSLVTIPWDHIYSAYYIINWAKTLGRELTIVAPDYGAAAKADFIAHKLKMPLAILRKERPKHNVAFSKSEYLMGNVKNRDLLLVDDIIDTSGTIIETIKILRMLGARKIFGAATHGVLSKPAKQRIEDCQELECVMITNTTPMSPRKKSKKIIRTSVHEIFAKAIKRVYDGGSIKELFEKELFY